MKGLIALLLSSAILISGLMPLIVEVDESYDAIMDQVIDRAIKEKANGNTSYYNLMIRYKDEKAKIFN